MMLTIAIISLVGYCFSVFSHLTNDELNVDVFIAAIVIISWWNICFPLALIMMVLTLIIGIFGSKLNDN